MPRRAPRPPATHDDEVAAVIGGVTGDPVDGGGGEARLDDDLGLDAVHVLTQERRHAVVQLAVGALGDRGQKRFVARIVDGRLPERTGGGKHGRRHDVVGCDRDDVNGGALVTPYEVDGQVERGMRVLGIVEGNQTLLNTMGAPFTRRASVIDSVPFSVAK